VRQLREPVQRCDGRGLPRDVPAKALDLRSLPSSTRAGSGTSAARTAGLALVKEVVRKLLEQERLSKLMRELSHDQS
jgi:hypothetical protein